MNRKRINNLKEELKLGRIERPEEQTQIVKRPILNELWSIFFTNVPPEKRQSYEDFINEIQGLTIDILNDPTLIDLDAFAKENREAANLVTDDRQTVGLICANHAEISKNDAQANEEEQKDEQNDQVQKEES